MYIVYGIKNCNTVKKALDWLNRHAIKYEFHDYKKLGIAKAKLSAWTKQIDWQELVNKKGTTWRNLSEEEKSSIHDVNAAIILMEAKTSVIKRPLIELKDKIISLGFDESTFEKAFT